MNKETINVLYNQNDFTVTESKVDDPTKSLTKTIAKMVKDGFDNNGTFPVTGILSITYDPNTDNWDFEKNTKKPDPKSLEDIFNRAYSIDDKYYARRYEVEQYKLKEARLWEMFKTITGRLLSEDIELHKTFENEDFYWEIYNTCDNVVDIFANMFRIRCKH